MDTTVMIILIALGLIGAGTVFGPVMSGIFEALGSILKAVLCLTCIAVAYYYFTGN